MSKEQATPQTNPQTTPLWEVFIRSRNGLSHKHVGSLHAADATLALQAARDVYTRRGEGLSVWVVPNGLELVAFDRHQRDGRCLLRGVRHRAHLPAREAKVCSAASTVFST